MTDETQCTALGKIDGKYAKRVKKCCAIHDVAYKRPRFPWRLWHDLKWGCCAWKCGTGIGHKAKTIAFTVLLMTVSWALYYNIIDWVYRRIPWTRRIKEWMG